MKKVLHMIDFNLPIESREVLTMKILAEDDVIITKKEVSDVLKNDLHFSYRQVHKVPIQGNSQRCLILRQKFAMQLLQLMESGTRIINVD